MVKARQRKGIVAAGHEETARAGTAVLEAGGNAVDAAIAAAFAGCVAEPYLIALGAGGFMLSHEADTSRQTLLDFFVEMPGQGLEKEARKLSKLVPTPLDFGGAVQMFHGGHASVGVPGLVAGLFAAHRRFASMPMRELIQPAKRLATEGVTMNIQQAFFFKLLSGVLALSDESKLVFFDGDNYFTEGQVFHHPNLPATLDELAEHGAESFYQGDLAEQLVAEVASGGGYLTKQDLAAYQVAERLPVRVAYRGTEIVSNPPPSSGGALIAHTLHLLSDFDLSKMQWLSYEHLRHLVETMRSTNEVRRQRFDDNIFGEDVLDRLLGEASILEDRSQVTNRLGNTTHISVVDNNGNAVSLTATNGANSGIGVPGTGILLNNILGEEDLNPQGFHQHPVGHRLTSMMAPTLVTADDQVRIALGSAGSNRIRSAVVQVISNILDFNQPVSEAVAAPRVHLEGRQLEIEAGIAEPVFTRLGEDGWPMNVWKDKNVFFGGAQAVVREPDGTLTGAGDLRRGGAVAMA